jgi:hypothetical protein
VAGQLEATARYALIEDQEDCFVAAQVVHVSDKTVTLRKVSDDSEISLRPDVSRRLPMSYRWQTISCRRA